MRGVLIEVFADGAGHCKAEIAVDINLADCHACRFAEHILGDTDCIRHVSAVFIDHLDKFGNDRACTVQNDRETGKTLLNLFKDIEPKHGLCAGFEFVCAVAGADCDCKAVNTGTLNKFLNLRGVGVACILCGNIDIVLDALKPSEFTLNNNAVIVCIFNDLTGEFDVVLEGMM